MKNNQLVKEKNLRVLSSMISDKIHSGFVLEEKNDKFQFAVLCKEEKKVNHKFNFIVFCLTLGLWALPWLYLTIQASKEEKILVAIDENGTPFTEKCLVA